MARKEKTREHIQATKSAPAQSAPTESASAEGAAQHEVVDAKHHIVPLKTYYMVFCALIVLLFITVGVAEIDLTQYWGPANVLVAMLIAATKAGLIVAIFMHLKFSSMMTRVFGLIALGFIFIMFLMTYMDYMTRSWLLPPGH